jgi:tryptophan synthase beta chain
MKQLPDKNGYFGELGGCFVAETLYNAHVEIEKAYRAFCKSSEMKRELNELLKHYAGRPTPLYFAKRLSAGSGIKIYMKREDLLHTGAHKLNNTLGQVLLARFMGKKRIIAETGAGQHGVATATVAALMGMSCTVYMGSLDVERQAPNVRRMKLLGAEVVPVDRGGRTLKDAINAAIKDWARSVRDTHYLVGSVVGAHPFPMIVRDFQSVVGVEARRQMKARFGRLPDFAVACVGGGSNAAGLFREFVRRGGTRLIGVEAGGRSSEPGQHSASLAYGTPGILQGSLTYLLQNDDCQVLPVHSVSAGLDYPAVGPEHGYYRDGKIVEYGLCDDAAALDACVRLTKTEGILPALESSHALGFVLENATRFRGRHVLVNLSGRGDKDMNIIERELGL